jgi:integrase
MRVRLKGLNSITKRLADGSAATYWYAWKGGPRLPGKPGEPEFMAAYNTAIASKVQAPNGVFFGLLQGYQQSQDFLKLADKTRHDYIALIKRVEREFGTLPLRALEAPKIRGEFKRWRDRMATNSGPRQADYAWTVLARVLSWALDNGDIAKNPCERGGRLYKTGARLEDIWTPEDEEQFLRLAPKHLHLAFLLAIWTGQRQGDLLRLPWSRYDGVFIRLRQSKRGKRLPIPVSPQLKAALDATPKRSPIILTTIKGKPWTSDGFRTSWGKACAMAGIEGLTFNDLRGSAVTRLAIMGCNQIQIAQYTGHSLATVNQILEGNYLAHDPAIVESAAKKYAEWNGGKT